MTQAFRRNGRQARPGRGGRCRPWRRGPGAAGQPRHRTIRDVEHVILMQENRAFDHYFGTMRGVRGRRSRPIDLPSGQPVWKQPAKDASRPSPLPPGRIYATRRDQGVQPSTTAGKASMPAGSTMTPGSAKGLPDHGLLHPRGPALLLCAGRRLWFATAPLFDLRPRPSTPTGCFCSLAPAAWAPATPARSWSPTPWRRPTTPPTRPGTDRCSYLAWPTYAERLQAAGVSWRVYQEYDNYGDNGLAYFKNFRGIGPGSALYQRARAWVPGSNEANAKTSTGRPPGGRAFAAERGRRPPAAGVSWICTVLQALRAPQRRRRPTGSTSPARLIAALASNFQGLGQDRLHPELRRERRASSTTSRCCSRRLESASGQEHGDDGPGGLSRRTGGPGPAGADAGGLALDQGRLRQLAAQRPHLGDPLPGGALQGAAEPQICPWLSRAVCRRPDQPARLPDVLEPRRSRDLPDASGLPALAPRRPRRCPSPSRPPPPKAIPRQEPGQRPARPLPYRLSVTTQVRGRLASSSRSANT